MHRFRARDTLFNMQKWILAVSPDREFLEQISAHLQEGGRFLVICASSGKDALAAAENQLFDLAILDSEISDHPFVPLTRELTALIPNLRILVYPPNNNPKHPAMNGLIANGFLNKPFFGPEVISKITNIFKEIPQEQLADQKFDKSLPELWMEDPSSGAQQIEQLLGATTAMAGLLLLRGQVIAGTGNLSDDSAGNIVNFLTRYWTNIQSGELFRYLRMNYETVTYLVYAVPLFKNVAIGLVYPPDASLENVRAEVTTLRKGFLSRYTSTGELRHGFGISTEALSNPAESLPQERPPQRAKTQPIPGESPSTTAEYEEEEESPLLSEEDLDKFNALIADMPSPDPEEVSPSTHPLSGPNLEEETFAPISDEIPLSMNEVAIEAESASEMFTRVPETEPVLAAEETPTGPSTSTSKTAPLPPLPGQQAEEQPQPAENFPNFDFKLPWEEEEENSAVEQVPPPLTVPPPLPVAEPSLSAGQEEAKPAELPPWFNEFVSLEPNEAEVKPNDLLFRYNILLLPRNEGQFITRPLSEVLNQNLAQLRKEYDWEFISISVRPQYLLWAAAFPLSVTVADVAGEVRRATNDKLFSHFPDLLHSHPSADFWANGYFAISGASSPSGRLIRDFIDLSKRVSQRSNNF